MSSNSFLFFSFLKKKKCLSYTYPWEGYLSLLRLLKGKSVRNSHEESACIQDRQDPKVSLCHQKDAAVPTLRSCHTLDFKSLRTSCSASSSPSSSLSAASPCKTLFLFSVTALSPSLQFPFPFLSFRLQSSLTPTSSPLSASQFLF